MSDVARPEHPAFPFSVGRYTVYEPFASGGMATVHPGLFSGPAGFSRQVAIKRLRPQYTGDPQFVSMFLDEARLAARIHHPNVVSTLDVIQADEELLLVMDLVEGVPLSRLLATGNPDARRIEIVLSIVVGVLHGLHAAHEAKNEAGEQLDLVHRDVSPQNILVGTDGVPRILDFGIAKAIGRLQGPTRLGEVKGKVHYLAPEQLSGRATRQSDIYAASVVLWEGLTGTSLFDGEHEAAVLNQVLRGPVAPPSELVAAISPSLDEIVMKGLERNPRKRFESAQEMALALTRAGPLAPAREVAAWVTEQCGTEIAALRDKLERDVMPASVEESARPKKPRRLARYGAALGALFIVCVALIVRAFTTSRPSSDDRTPLSSSLDVTGADALQGTAPAVVAASSTPAQREDSPKAPAPSRSDVPSKTRPARGGPKKQCDSPYSVDPDGVRRIRRECL
jgi:eukaryotic-like serine/threonine-protein kinase